jgi:hypothetical protein
MFSLTVIDNILACIEGNEVLETHEGLEMLCHLYGLHRWRSRKHAKKLIESATVWVQASTQLIPSI